MDVGKSSIALISVKLNKLGRDRLLHLIIVFQDSVNCFWDVVHNDVEVYFIWLFKFKHNNTYLISLSVESMLEGNDIRMEEFLHDL